MITLAPASTAKLSNLAFALRCLPADRREDALVFFRFCRAVDDLADDPAQSGMPGTLEEWRQALQTGQGLPSELVGVFQKYRIEQELPLAIVEGCLMDVGEVVFVDLDALRKYCWRVACAVGLCSIRIFGCTSPRSVVFAEHLGYALQFTNILRDVGEDARNGRVYLPKEWMTTFHVCEHELLETTVSPNLRDLLSAWAGLARQEFAAARESLPEEDARALRPARLMAALYESLLGKIEHSRFDVLSRRHSLSRMEKLLSLARIWLPDRKI